MTRELIEVTRQDRIYCLKASSDYHSELCEECRFYPNCDHVTQDDMTELTIEDLEALEQEPFVNKTCISSKVCEHDKEVVLDKIRAEIKKSSHGKWYVGRIDGKTEEVLLLDEVMQILDKYKAESEGKE